MINKIKRGWDGFLNWYNDTFPKREYQKYTNRATDFYPPLNQAKVFLSETNKPGVLDVVVEGFTPGGFESLLVKVNDGALHTEKIELELEASKRNEQR